ncbi:MAG: type VI secretion system-associated protein TagF [Limnobacter sp.]|nr:type VI secretion system-associated protein TagF [Limnobacter sp.]
MHSPIWRFAISPHAMHSQGAMGVVMPSMDKIGRYFPLTLSVLGPVRPWRAFLDCTEWFKAAEQILLLALDDATNRQTLTDQADALELPKLSLAKTDNRQYRQTNSGMQLGLPDSQSPLAGWNCLEQSTQAHWPYYSLWWSEAQTPLRQVYSVAMACQNTGNLPLCLMDNGSGGVGGKHHSKCITVDFHFYLFI